MKIWTLHEGLDCAQRELNRRRERYPAMVKAGKLSSSDSEHEIAAMQYVCDIISDRIRDREGYVSPPSVIPADIVSQRPFPLKIEDLKPEVQEGLGL